MYATGEPLTVKVNKRAYKSIRTELKLQLKANIDHSVVRKDSDDLMAQWSSGDVFIGYLFMVLHT